MKALVTGASSGIGRDIARALAKRGCALILTARRQDRLKELQNELQVPVRIIALDLANEAGAHALYEAVKGEEIDILVNNAGFGAFGTFPEIPLERELEMISLNIRSLHILTKLFLHDFKDRNAGYILNVSSSSAFLPGPLMATYYATKAYVMRLTLAVSEELRREGSAVRVCALCPGPVGTEFNKRADVVFSPDSLPSGYVAEYAVGKMLRGKRLIIPGFQMKCARFIEHFLPETALARAAWHLQKRKRG